MNIALRSLKQFISQKLFAARKIISYSLSLHISFAPTKLTLKNFWESDSTHSATVELIGG